MHVEGKWLLVAGVIVIAALLEAAIFAFVLPSGILPSTAVTTANEP